MEGGVFWHVKGGEWVVRVEKVEREEKVEGGLESLAPNPCLWDEELVLEVVENGTFGGVVGVLAELEEGLV